MINEMKKDYQGRGPTVPFLALHCALQAVTLCSLEHYTVLYFKMAVGCEKGRG